MKPPQWMRNWVDSIIETGADVEVDVAAFKAGRTVPRQRRGTSPTTAAAIDEGHPQLNARVGRRLKGAGLSCCFRLDLDRDGKHVRSYAVAWRREKGTFIVLRCGRDARSIQDGANWIIENELGPAEYQGKRALAYKAFFSHLNEGGHALRADEAGRVRTVVRALHELGLELQAAEADPRRRPLLFTPGASATDWLGQVANATLARMVCAGLLGSKHWAEEARRLLGWTNETFDAFAYGWGWRGLSAVREAALERDLCARFKRWATRSKPGVDVVAEDQDGALYDYVDGQRPDLRIVEGADEVVIEAKLGLTRSSVRTGLAQAREYAYHLAESGRPRPVLLLLAEPPSFHGARFAEYVRDTAERLQVGVVVEQGAIDFRVWKPIRGYESRLTEDGFIAWICSGD